MNKYFKSLGKDAKIKNLEELIAFNKKDSIEMEFYNQRYLEMALEKEGLDSDGYKETVSKMLKGAKTIDTLVSEDGSTELLGKGVEITAEALREVPFELIGYLPLEPALEERLSEYFADVRNRINRVRQKAMI